MTPTNQQTPVFQLLQSFGFYFAFFHRPLSTTRLTETKEDIIAATKLSLEESQNDLQLEADIANYNAEYELKADAGVTVPPAVNEAIPEKTEEIVQQPAETEPPAANETAQTVAEEPVQKVESESVEEKPAETEPAKKHGLLSAASTAASTPAAASKPAEPAESTGFFQSSDDDAIILPMDDFDTLFKDCESNV